MSEVASVLDLPADGFDRRKPVYRLFDMEDGTRQWWTVIQELNAPGTRAMPSEESWCYAYVAQQPWADLFWAAFEKNGKATIYEATT